MRLWHFSYVEAPEKTEPDWRRTPLHKVHQRARALLRARTPNDIDYLLMTLNSLLSEAVSDLLSTAGAAHQDLNPSIILLSRTKTIDLGAQPHLENVQWSEYFAALTLGLIGQAFEFTRPIDREQWAVEILDPPIFRQPAELIFYATNAVAIAEDLERTRAAEEEREAHKRTAYKKRTKLAADTRWTPSRRLKEKFLADLQCGRFGNICVRAAARRYYWSLSEEERRIICPSGVEANAVRTLTEFAARNTRTLRRA